MQGQQLGAEPAPIKVPSTVVVKLDIMSSEDIAQDIVNTSENQFYGLGRKLRGMFESNGELVMVFQWD